MLTFRERLLCIALTSIKIQRVAHKMKTFQILCVCRLNSTTEKKTSRSILQIGNFYISIKLSQINMQNFQQS